MYQIDVSTVATTKPASTTLGTVGYFTDGNASTGLAATVVPAEFLNAVMLELMNIVTDAGMTLSKSSADQVSTAIQLVAAKNAGSYAVDSGSANAYAVTLSPVPLALTDGMVVRFQASSTNTATSTLNVNGLGAYVIKGQTNVALGAGEIVSGGYCECVYKASSKVFLLKASFGAPAQVEAGSYLSASPAQFDSSTKLADTAFVQAALGSLSGYTSVSAATTLTAANIGQNITCSAASAVTITLPLVSAVAVGAALSFRSSSAYTASVATQGSDVIGNGITSLSAVPVKQGDTLFLMSTGSQWLVIGGSAALPYSALFASTLASSGYQKLPSGLIIQWFRGTSSGTTAPNLSFTFPIAFPTALLSLSTCTTGGAAIASEYSTTLTTANFSAYSSNTAALASGLGFMFVAIGY